MEGLYFKYSDLQKALYGQKVYKLPVNYAVSCPNRDGTKGYGGCIFCSEKGSSHEAHENTVEISSQIIKNKEYIGPRYGAKLFDVYFQSYTNTYMPLDIFKGMINTAVNATDGIVGLSISTRPDCIDERYLDFLKEIKEKYSVGITIELGLQSVNERTLEKINRGHTLSDYVKSVILIKSYGFNVCTHMISTLPWDTENDLIDGAKMISALCGYGDSVKIHTLYIEDGTVIGEMYKNGEFEMPDMEEYFIRTSSFLANLKPDIAMSRLTGRVSSETALFENWGRSHWVVEDGLREYMTQNGIIQGINYSDGNTGGMGRFRA